MMKCSNCGKENADGGKFCLFCGTALNSDTAAAPATVAEIPVQQTKAPESVFTGGLWGLIGISLLQMIIVIFTLGFGVPWAICVQQRWIAEHTFIDGKQLVFDGKGGQLFGNYIKWFFLTLITLGIYGFWLSINMQKWITKHTHHRS